MDTLVHFTPDSMVRITSTTTWCWRQEHRFLHLIPSQVGTISFLIGSKKPRKKYTKKVHSYAYNPFWDVSAYIGSYRSMKKCQNRVLPWRNWLARSTVNRKVGGSSPPGSDVFWIPVRFRIQIWNSKFLVDNSEFIWQGTYIHGILGSRPGTDNFRNFVLLKIPLPGGLEPPTFRLTVERANQLRHGSMAILGFAF